MCVCRCVCIYIYIYACVCVCDYVCVCDILYPYKLLCCKSYSCDCLWSSFAMHGLINTVINSHIPRFIDINHPLDWRENMTLEYLGITGSPRAWWKKLPETCDAYASENKSNWLVRHKINSRKWCQRWKSFVRAPHSRSFSKWQRPTKTLTLVKDGMAPERNQHHQPVEMTNTSISSILSISSRGGCSPRSQIRGRSIHLSFWVWWLEYTSRDADAIPGLVNIQ